MEDEQQNISDSNNTHNESVTCISSDLQADEDLLEFLDSLGTEINPLLFHKQELPIRGLDRQSVAGHVSVELIEGSFRDTPCYFLSISSHFQPEPNVTCKRSVASYISPNLRTLMQSVYHVLEGPDGTTETVQEMILEDEDENMIITETEAGAESRKCRIEKDHVRGLLTEGSVWVLARILAHKPQPKPLPFFTFSENALGKTTYSVQSTHDAENIITVSPYIPPSISIDSLRSDTLAEEEAASTPKQNGDALVCLFDPSCSKTIALTSTGACSSIRPHNSPYMIQVIEEAQTSTQQKGKSICNGEQVQDPFATRDFGGNIELQSEYAERKRELKTFQEGYITQHPDLSDIMADYLQLVLHRKPQDVYSFTIEYFSI
ncbi:hypothetical protein SpCBS45565_g01446 [Spizellomyces sp. 'palustris']|nr:hypothetical protein SpCBS45565_g01446 [Spizellomyces sp. 'palustris']